MTLWVIGAGKDDDTHNIILSGSSRIKKSLWGVGPWARCVLPCCAAGKATKKLRAPVKTLWRRMTDGRKSAIRAKNGR